MQPISISLENIGEHSKRQRLAQPLGLESNKGSKTGSRRSTLSIFETKQLSSEELFAQQRKQAKERKQQQLLSAYAGMGVSSSSASNTNNDSLVIHLKSNDSNKKDLRDCMICDSIYKSKCVQVQKHTTKVWQAIRFREFDQLLSIGIGGWVAQSEPISPIDLAFNIRWLAGNAFCKMLRLAEHETIVKQRQGLDRW